MMMPASNRGAPPRETDGFAEAWLEHGGELEHISFADTNPEDDIPIYGEEQILTCFDRPDAPTALFGARDVDAWCVQGVLARHRPGILGRLCVVGSGNTPWSQAAQPPFTTLDWNLEHIARQAAALIARGGRVEDGGEKIEWVQPKLVIRPAAHHKG